MVVFDHARSHFAAARPPRQSVQHHHHVSPSGPRGLEDAQTWTHGDLEWTARGGSRPSIPDVTVQGEQRGETATYRDDLERDMEVQTGGSFDPGLGTCHIQASWQRIPGQQRAVEWHIDRVSCRRNSSFGACEIGNSACFASADSSWANGWRRSVFGSSDLICCLYCSRRFCQPLFSIHWLFTSSLLDGASFVLQLLLLHSSSPPLLVPLRPWSSNRTVSDPPGLLLRRCFTEYKLFSFFFFSYHRGVRDVLTLDPKGWNAANVTPFLGAQPEFFFRWVA